MESGTFQHARHATRACWKFALIEAHLNSLSLLQLEPLQEVLSEVVGFEDAIREFALHTIGMTCGPTLLVHSRFTLLSVPSRRRRHSCRAPTAGSRQCL